MPVLSKNFLSGGSEFLNKGLFLFLLNGIYKYHFVLLFLLGDGFDSLGGVLQPTSLTGSQTITNGNTPTTKNENTEQPKSSTLLTGDLESSLASLAENLSINNRPQPVK